jgi:hypothetical protein
LPCSPPCSHSTWSGSSWGFMASCFGQYLEDLVLYCFQLRHHGGK